MSESKNKREREREEGGRESASENENQESKKERERRERVTEYLLLAESQPGPCLAPAAALGTTWSQRHSGPEPTLRLLFEGTEGESPEQALQRCFALHRREDGWRGHPDFPQSSQALSLSHNLELWSLQPKRLKNSRATL